MEYYPCNQSISQLCVCVCVSIGTSVHIFSGEETCVIIFLRKVIWFGPTVKLVSMAIFQDLLVRVTYAVKCHFFWEEEAWSLGESDVAQWLHPQTLHDDHTVHLKPLINWQGVELCDEQLRCINPSSEKYQVMGTKSDEERCLSVDEAYDLTRQSHQHYYTVCVPLVVLVAVSSPVVGCGAPLELPVYR